MNRDMQFPLARYRFDCVAATSLRLPEYAGSLLRGAFGRALRQVACMTRTKDCAPCPLRAGCPYTAVFEPGRPVSEHPRLQNSAIPPPYVIEPPAWGARTLAPGEPFAFYMVLIGGALDHLPIVILAWRRALARGLGQGDGTAHLAAVAVESGETIHTPADGRIAAHATGVTLERPEQAPAAITLDFVTPLRLQEAGRALPPHRLGSRALLLALARRASLLGEFHCGGAPAIDFHRLAVDADTVGGQRHLQWRDWTRYSSRQERCMTLGGVLGTWTLAGNLALAWPWLQLGQWLHVGKETVFGLGAYRLKTAVTADIPAGNDNDGEAPTQAFERKEEITAPQSA